MHIEQGEKYVYFGRQYPLGRVLATTEALLDPHQYEAYTFLKAGTDQEPPAVERDATGKLVMRWRRGVPLLTEKAEQQMIERGVIRPEEAWCRLRDVKTGRRVRVHGSSVAWNEYRGCWSMIALEAFGSSALGEVWYAEAPDPVGPWTTAVKIVTHEKYSFYNPRQHPMLAKQDGRIIYFEGTYTNTFSGNSDQTPRYNYNQIMYRLDLDDPRLMLPPR